MTSRTCVVVPSIDKMVERLRKGQKWMTVRRLDAADRPESPLNIPILASLDQWDQLDAQLRELGFKGCPIGPNGCDLDAPMICQGCVDSGKRLDGNGSQGRLT